MRVERDVPGVVVDGDGYRLHVGAAEPIARLADLAGGQPMQLMLLAGVDSDRGLDGTITHGLPSVSADRDGCTITFEVHSTLWDRKEVRLRCTADAVTFDATVAGGGRLTTVRLLGGRYTGSPRWGGGVFHSRWGARTLFDPSPDDPKRVVQPATEAATIGVVGGSLPGRGHWFFTPAPFLFAGTASAVTDPDASSDPWQTLELRASADDATFSEVRYHPVLGGFSLELDYEGQTAVDGSFTTPPLVIRLGVADPYAAVARHCEDLRGLGLAPSVARRRPEWWTRPIFCGWGEQCRQAKLDDGEAATYSRQSLYDASLATLGAHGVVPGTIVIDDKWQVAYGTNAPDPTRWPDLRGWIAERHASAQHVLLWFKAWDPEGLPSEACVVDGAGRPVAADPTSPVYEELVGEQMRAMLGAGGLDADGLKVDFTALTPSGPGLRRRGEAWGVALLHRLLALVYRSAKAAKADALIVTHAASPLFADTLDMVRLNDLMRLGDPDPVAPAVPQMRHRARVAAALESDVLIDTDDWCMPSRAEWRAYLDAKPELGVPALYYANGIDYSGEPFTDDDYAAIRDAWARAEARRVQRMQDR